MKFLVKLYNLFFYHNRYKSHSEAVIVACYYNPTNNPYRLTAFNTFYESIKHLNHRIVECVIGDSEPQLPVTEFITRLSTNTTLWHKEALLNGIIKNLPAEFKYVFWIDADVKFTNLNWMVDAVEQLQPQNNRMVQLFEYCIHLDQDQTTPNFDVEFERQYVATPALRHPKMWRSFGANYATTDYSGDSNYDRHGHVGFAWGVRRSVVDTMPLYDKALIGGGDHIMSHAAVGQIGHSCITKSFTDDIDAVNEWSERFSRVVGKRLGYVKGDLYHIWHGDVTKRQYLKRIQDFTPIAKGITEKDANGLYVTDNDEYVKQYMNHREDTGSTKKYKAVDMSYTKLYPEVQDKHKIVPDTNQRMVLRDAEFKRREKLDSELKEKARRDLRRQYPSQDNSFIESMVIGYITDSTVARTLGGGNLIGAAFSNMLNNNDQVFDTNDNQLDQGFDGGFGGGGFSGGGAGGSWDDNIPTDNTDNTAYSSSENFS